MKQIFLVVLFSTTVPEIFAQSVGLPQESDALNTATDFKQEMDRLTEQVKGLERTTAAEISQLQDTVLSQGRAIKILTEQLQHENQQTKALIETLLVLQSSSINDGISSHVEKRQGADDVGALHAVVNQLTAQLTEVVSNVEALQAKGRQLDEKNSEQDDAISAQEGARGAVYTRWGHAACPAGAELVYSGSVGGSHYSASGGAANQLCLPPNPVFDNHTPNMSYGTALIYGTEYETCPEPECQNTPSCAVCRIPRGTSVMVPATNTCSPGWNLEYSGYIMAGRARVDHLAPTEYICVDSSRQYLPGSSTNDDENVLYYAIFKCGSLVCPPYVNNKVSLCAVCSK